MHALSQSSSTAPKSPKEISEMPSCTSHKTDNNIFELLLFFFDFTYIWLEIITKGRNHANGGPKKSWTKLKEVESTNVHYHFTPNWFCDGISLFELTYSSHVTCIYSHFHCTVVTCQSLFRAQTKFHVASAFNVSPCAQVEPSFLLLSAFFYGSGHVSQCFYMHS